MITENKSRFLWGYGISDAFSHYKYNLMLFNFTEENIDDPHNTYVSLLLMFGFITTLFIVLFIISVLFFILKQIFKEEDKFVRYYFIFSFSILTSIFIQGFFDSELIVVEYFTIQFLLTVIGINYYLFANANLKKKLL